MGTWSLPQSLDKAQQFAELMQQPLLAHDATSKLYYLFGDDDLFDAIEAMKRSREETDVRPLVKYALYQFFYADRVVEPWNEEALNILQTAF